jgi:hypothetical protein
MGFFSALGKVAYGAVDFAADAMEHTAKRINRMSDDEIKQKYSEPVETVRGRAEMAQMKAEMWQMKKEERKMREEMLRMEEERLSECNKKV